MNKKTNKKIIKPKVKDINLDSYIKPALEVIKFHIIHNLEDLNRREEGFGPTWVHQIFKNNESIFGYTKVSVDIYYLHNSAKCYLEIRTSGTIPSECERKPDDIETILKGYLPKGYVIYKKDFCKELKQENHGHMFGKILTSYEPDDDNATYYLTSCPVDNIEFRNFHHRFQTFVFWFIDGGSFIRLENKQPWNIFYIYKQTKQPSKDSCTSSAVGFVTVYLQTAEVHYHNAQLSQFFILPPYQRKGLGTLTYQTLFEHYRQKEMVKQITVESPSEKFQNMRIFLDCVRAYNILKIENLQFGTANLRAILKRIYKEKFEKKYAKDIIYSILQLLYNEDKSDDRKVGIKHHLPLKENNESKKQKVVKKTEALLYKEKLHEDKLKMVKRLKDYL